jgi:hypothetical protein
MGAAGGWWYTKQTLPSGMDKCGGKTPVIGGGGVFG